MNIFCLDNDPIKCAQMHMDRHIVKMPWEYMEILTGRANQFSDWVKKADGNYNWLATLYVACCEEFRFRYSQRHPALKQFLPGQLADPTMSGFILHVPRQARISDNPILCYREYYNKYLWHMATWSFREVPAWFKPGYRELFYLGDDRADELHTFNINISRQLSMSQWES